jgi:hypothetical protein
MNALKEFTHMECLECCSVHTMNYCLESYECEECYRNVPFNEANKSELLFNKQKFISFLLTHKSEAKKYIITYMRYVGCTDIEAYNNELICQYYLEIINKNNPYSEHQLFIDYKW